MNILLPNHLPYLGMIAKFSEQGLVLAVEYLKEFGFGNGWHEELMLIRCTHNDLLLIFIDYPPMIINGVVLYCLKEVGKGIINGDWHWYSLNQLTICNEKL